MKEYYTYWHALQSPHDTLMQDNPVALAWHELGATFANVTLNK